MVICAINHILWRRLVSNTNISQDGCYQGENAIPGKPIERSSQSVVKRPRIFLTLMRVWIHTNDVSKYTPENISTIKFKTNSIDVPWWCKGHSHSCDSLGLIHRTLYLSHPTPQETVINKRHDYIYIYIYSDGLVARLVNLGIFCQQWI